MQTATRVAGPAATGVAVLLLTTAAASADADDEACVPDTQPPATPVALDEASLATFDRLTGYWRGEGFGGLVEEWWSPRDGQELFGVFRGSHGGKTDFYEFMKIELDPAGGRQIVRHLDAAGAPWFYRPVDTIFAIAGVSDTCIRFEGVAYRVDAPDRLTVTVRMEQGGKISTAEIRFTRAPAP